MGDIFRELAEVRRIKQERLTPAEENVLLTCESKAVRDFTAGALVGSGVTWLATWRFNRALRVYFSGCAGFFFGSWNFDRSLESCVDRVLQIDGSWLQKELANIIVSKYQDDPSRMRLISKHFYSEKVYDDSTSDQPKLRWRYRNYFSDDVTYGQRTQDADSYGDFHSDSYNNPLKESQNDPGSKKNDFASKNIPVKPAIDLMTDPLDCVFGYIASTEEIHHHNSSSMPTKLNNRNQKKSHRRSRMRRHESVDLKQA